MIREIRRILGDDERRFVSDDEIIRQFNRAQDVVKAKRANWWFLKKEDSNIITVANQRQYGLNDYVSDLGYIDTIRYRYDDGTDDIIYQLRNITPIEMDRVTRDNDATADDWPSAYTIDPADSSDATGYFSIDLKPLTAGRGTFYIRYFKEMADLDDVSDATDVPIPSILEDFALAYGFRVKGDEKRAKIYEERFWGPQGGREEQYREQTGLRLLEIMQNNKGRAIGQPESLKRFRGRHPIKKFFQSSNTNRDLLKEKYF